jgi:uncharacterized protein YhhL (DUF1145 family)
LILVLKLVVLATWLTASIGLLLPDTTLFGRAGRVLLLGLVLAHAVECAVFFRTLKQTGRPLGLELMNTFLFGIAHLGEVKALIDARDDDR